MRRWAVLGALIALTGCGGGDDEAPLLSSEELTTLKRLGPLPPLPASPTNRFADDPGARALGQAMFFDTRMSSDGTVACSTCHVPTHGFADSKPLSVGVRGRLGARHASALVNTAFNQFQFWDGRADSLWAQPHQALENPNESDFGRCEVAHFIEAQRRGAYEAVFGSMPDLTGVPAKCRPDDGVWETLDAETQQAVNTVLVNVGKAFEAYVRTLVSRGSKLDRWIAGDTAALSESELRGAKVFVSASRGACATCHDGPNLTDNGFHVLGIPQPDGELDEGRFDGVVTLLKDPFNGDGAFSDAPGGRLDGIIPRPPMKGQFKTPSLRDVSRRPPYGHAGSFATLEDFVDFHDRGSGDPARDRYAGTKEAQLVPIGFTAQERADLVAFLKALEGEPLPLGQVTPPP